MPCSPAKVRLLLKEKKAVIKRRTPFTVQLTQATGEAHQPVRLGVDAGSKYVGLSASTEKTELYASEVVLRTDVVDLSASTFSFVMVTGVAIAVASPKIRFSTSITSKAGKPAAMRRTTSSRSVRRAIRPITPERLS